MIIVAFGRFETRRLRAIPSFTLRADTIGGAQGDTRAGKSECEIAGKNDRCGFANRPPKEATEKSLRYAVRVAVRFG
jgi:hypothetical protein